MEHPGRVFTREQLLDEVWGRDIYVEPRTVDVHIRRLRKALNADGDDDLIRTVRGGRLRAGRGQGRPLKADPALLRSSLAIPASRVPAYPRQPARRLASRAQRRGDGNDRFCR